MKSLYCDYRMGVLSIRGIRLIKIQLFMYHPLVRRELSSYGLLVSIFPIQLLGFLQQGIVCGLESNHRLKVAHLLLLADGLQPES